MKIQRCNEIARKNLLAAKEKRKQYYDKKINPIRFNAGNMVYLLNETGKIQKIDTKLFRSI